jgi:hypothetical protein
MTFLVRLFLLIGCSVALSAAQATPGADVLNRWAGGKWVGEGKTVDSDYSKAGKANGVSTCAWSPDHVYVVCDQNIEADDGPLLLLSIYAFDPKTSKYHFYGMDRSGEQPRSGDLEISRNGDYWVYPGSAEIQGKTVQFRTTNEFHGKDAVEWRSEFSTDGGKTWTKTGEGKETRQK